MSIKGHIKEAAGAVKEEMNEHGKTPESQRKAAEGRELRNEGRVEDAEDHAAGHRPLIASCAAFRYRPENSHASSEN